MAIDAQDLEFRHPEAVAFLRSLTDEQAAKQPPLVLEQDGVAARYWREGGRVRCREVEASVDPSSGTGALHAFMRAAEAEFGRSLPRLEAELRAGGVPDLDAIEASTRDGLLGCGTALYAALLEALGGELPSPPCPDCGRRMERHSRTGKTFQARMGPVRTERTYFRCREVDSLDPKTGEPRKGRNSRAPRIRIVCEEILPGRKTIFILDLYHALEYASAALQAVPPDKGKQEAWMDWIRKQLDARRVKRVVAALKRHRRFEAVAACIRTCEANMDRMRCDLYRRRELPVGSGIVESACKRIVGSRLKGAGCHWSTAGANAVLAIGRCLENRRWPDFLEWRAGSAPAA